MDLNMVKGLGPKIRQTLFQSGIDNVEDLVKKMPIKMEFNLLSDLSDISSDEIITIEAIVLMFDSNDENNSVLCESNNIKFSAFVNSNVLFKQMIPGSKVILKGLYQVNNNIFIVEEINSNQAFIVPKYNVEDLASSQVHSFIEKGLSLLEKYDNELPMYIKEKLKIDSYKDIFLCIHFPKSKDTFVKSLRKRIYSLMFEYFTLYFYYIYSSSSKKQNENFDLVKINNIIQNIEFIQQAEKKILNDIFKEFNKPFYTNILVEKCSDNEKKAITLVLSIAKVSNKKQVVIVSNENFDLYASLKESFTVNNIKMEVMSKKGRNKDNFSNFNSKKFDIVLTTSSNFENVSKEDIGLIIIDNSCIDLRVRNSIGCNNCDTVFITNTNFGLNFDRNIFKNISLINNTQNVKFDDMIYTNMLSGIDCEIFKENISVDEIKNILLHASNDASEFIKNKKYKETKENYEYLKKVINNFKNEF